MKTEAWLRAGLDELADRYDVVDLRNRALATSRRLGRRRAAVGSAIVAVLLAAGAGFLALRPTAGPVPAPGATTAVPTPTPDGPIQGDALQIPPGAIDITNATVDIPLLPRSFTPCQGRQTFRHNLARPPADEVGYRSRVSKIVAGDVTGDGKTDTVALIECSFSEATRWQVVAFEGTADQVHTIGPVLARGSDPRVEIVFGLRVRAGQVELELGDYDGLIGGHVDELSQRQTRRYRWSGDQFVQSGGPTSFGANPNFPDLHLTVPDLVLGRPVNGVRHGILTVTVENRGPVETTDSEVDVLVPIWLALDGGRGCYSQDIGLYRRVSCDVGRVDGIGDWRAVTLQFTAASDTEAKGVPADCRVTALTIRRTIGAEQFPAGNPGDEEVPLRISRA